MADSHAGDDLTCFFSDQERLQGLQRLVESCSPEAPPSCRLLSPERVAEAKALAVLAGSFNPLTVAHLALAEMAEREQLGLVVFTLATRTIDKERPEGALLADRLLVLEAHTCRFPSRSVALVNRGLFVEQADLLISAVAGLRELTFLVGFDKIVQLFDARYYRNRDAALSQLFARACFAVAPRSGSDHADLTRLLARPENARFAARVRPIDVGESLAGVSSSSIRAALFAGDPQPSGLTPESAAFIRATGCYRPSTIGPSGTPVDNYTQRRALLLAQN